MTKFIEKSELEEFYKKLVDYPNLNKLLSQKILKGDQKKFYKGDEFSIFSIVLSKQPYWNQFLKRLDLLVDKIGFYTDKKKRNKIFDNVFNFLSELEFGQRLIDFDVIPKTDVIYYKKKDMDYWLPSDIYVEITTPKLNQNDEETWMKRACAVPTNFGLEKTLLRKIQSQEMNYAVDEGFSKPILILINGDYRGIDTLNAYSSVSLMQESYVEEFKSISGLILNRLNTLTFIPNKISINKLSDDNIIELKKVGVRFPDSEKNY